MTACARTCSHLSRVLASCAMHEKRQQVILQASALRGQAALCLLSAWQYAQNASTAASAGRVATALKAIFCDHYGINITHCLVWAACCCLAGLYSS